MATMDGETVLGNVLFIPTLLLMVLAFGAVIRRLLGVRVGVVRTLLAAVLALLLAGPLVVEWLPDPEHASTGTALLFLLLAVCVSSLLAMVALVVAEVIVPDGTLPGLFELWLSWRSRVARAAATCRSCGSPCGTGSAGSSAGSGTPAWSRRRRVVSWSARCAAPWTRAASRSSSSASATRRRDYPYASPRAFSMRRSRGTAENPTHSVAIATPPAPLIIATCAPAWPATRPPAAAPNGIAPHEISR